MNSVVLGINKPLGGKMRKWIYVFAALSMGIAASIVAKADDTSSGCGLGWAVTKKVTLSGTTTRNTTHSTLPPTFGMTSGTSGCAQHSFAKKEQEAVLFAMANTDALSIEMAQGQGEYLQAFARTFGCKDNAGALFGEVVQKNYNAIFSEKNTNGVDVFRNTQSQIRKNTALAAQCDNA